MGKKIKDLPVHLRPREKLMARGVENLSDKELLAILIRTGRSGKSALDLGNEVLQRYKVTQLMGATFEDLKKIKGLDSGKICTVLTAMELARRALEEFDQSLPVMRGVEDVVGQVYELRNYKKEYLVGLYLNARNQLISKEIISMGTVSASLISP